MFISTRYTQMHIFSAKMQIFSEKRRKQTTGLCLKKTCRFCNPYQKDNTGILLNCFEFSCCRGQTVVFCKKPPNLI